jgi:hypothetical protein
MFRRKRRRGRPAAEFRALTAAFRMTARGEKKVLPDHRISG